jgi:competence protein ComEA
MIISRHEFDSTTARSDIMKSNLSLFNHQNFFAFLIFSCLLALPTSPTYAGEIQTAAPQTININTADAQTIANHLKGIGLKKAEAIVDYRERYGEFAHLDELIAVKGIGKSTISKNMHLLSLN